MLTRLMALTKAQLKSKVQAIDASAVKGRDLRRKFEKIRNKQGGFTLLELLVVVAILAAIAGTATVMLQDTDRKASAAAHVAMMDELSKGIQTFRTMNNAFPDNWDSLMQVASATTAYTSAEPLVLLSDDLLGSIATDTLGSTEVTTLSAAGITQVRVVAGGTEIGGTGGTACVVTSKAELQAIINDKSNDLVAQNVYRRGSANGCGADGSHTLTASDPVMLWNTSANRRVNAHLTGDVVNGVTLGVDDRLVAFGVGPDTTLFDPAYNGALSNVPVYRHVEPDEYNRFVVLFKVSGSGVSDKAAFQAIVDGAGDTKDEELGELDGTRGT
jgi:prepilin-type N-terminal cleavage/methylation domain-containing protein